MINSADLKTPAALRTYVINLDRSTARWQQSCALLDAAGLDYERISGVDGLVLTDAERAMFRKWTSLVRYGWPMLNAHIACALSHRRALQRFLDSDATCALILEDDHAALPSIVRLLEQLIQSMPRDWTVVNLGHDSAKHLTFVTAIVDAGVPRNLMAAHDFPVRTTACLWSRRGAAQFMEHSRLIYAPVDVILQDYSARAGGAFLLTPPPVLFRDISSDLETINDTLRPAASPRRLRKIARVAVARLFTEVRNLRNLVHSLRNQRAYRKGR